MLSVSNDIASVTKSTSGVLFANRLNEIDHQRKKYWFDDKKMNMKHKWYSQKCVGECHSPVRKWKWEAFLLLVLSRLAWMLAIR